MPIRRTPLRRRGPAKFMRDCLRADDDPRVVVGRTTMLMVLSTMGLSRRAQPQDGSSPLTLLPFPLGLGQVPSCKFCGIHMPWLRMFTLDHQPLNAGVATLRLRLLTTVLYARRRLVSVACVNMCLPSTGRFRQRYDCSVPLVLIMAA